LNYESKNCIERADIELRLYRENQDCTARAEIVQRELGLYRGSCNCTGRAEVVPREQRVCRER